MSEFPTMELEEKKDDGEGEGKGEQEEGVNGGKRERESKEKDTTTTTTTGEKKVKVQPETSKAPVAAPRVRGGKKKQPPPTLSYTKFHRLSSTIPEMYGHTGYLTFAVAPLQRDE